MQWQILVALHVKVNDGVKSLKHVFCKIFPKRCGH